MDSDVKSRKQVSYEQLKALLDFLKEYPELAKGLARGRRGKLQTLKLWNLCAKKINVFKDGATKNGKGWAKYWCDWKYRVRRRALELKAASNGSSMPPDAITPLSQMEENILTIIGEQAVEGVIIKQDPLAEMDTPEDNQDTHEDVATNEFFATNSKTNRGQKRRYSDTLDMDDNSFQDRVPVSNKNGHVDDTDDEVSEFLRLEREKLENGKRIRESVETIASEVSRLADVMSQIRDVLINRVNL